MITRTDRAETTTTWYDIEFPASAYTFPHETLLQGVRFDDVYIHLEMTDGRRLSVPLQWIPTLRHAHPSEREKHEICSVHEHLEQSRLRRQRIVGAFSATNGLGDRGTRIGSAKMARHALC